MVISFPERWETDNIGDPLFFYRFMRKFYKFIVFLTISLGIATLSGCRSHKAVREKKRVEKKQEKDYKEYVKARDAEVKRLYKMQSEDTQKRMKKKLKKAKKKNKGRKNNRKAKSCR
ncbi:MAG: hypothetical protein GXO89_16755 [Chlorobi bacterium]|nr:hypothetical protein [Chlorobiota bacterium]